ncbi:MAG: Na+/H+ antiporter, partial [Chitinophagaceae bacterium]
PPLLYDAAWHTSWDDFVKWRRPISLLSIGLVIATSIGVAMFASHFISGFTLSMGFVLGGIVSPPDAIAAASILKNLKVPKRITTILEGESLVNDASSLIVLRFSLAAVASGYFSLSQATTDFFLSTILGIGIGISIAAIIYLIHRYLPTTASIDAAFTIISPYLMYLGAEQLQYSGVMAVVSGGLFLSHRSNEIFSDGQSRLQSTNVWATLTVVLNALVFILIGLQLPVIVSGLEGYSLREATVCGLLISLLVIIIRLAWIYPATFIPRWLFTDIRKKEPAPGWKSPMIIGWAGMRGIVSLAAALSLPITIAANVSFPGRNLIIFITFIVILVTLVFQGLTLPFLIRYIKINEIDPTVPETQQEVLITIRLLKASLTMLERFSIKVDEIDSLHALKIDFHNRLDHELRRLESQELEEVEEKENEVHDKVLQEIFRVQRS